MPVFKPHSQQPEISRVRLVINVNGTLVNDLHHKISTTNKTNRSFSIPPVTESIYRRLYSQSGGPELFLESIGVPKTILSTGEYIKKWLINHDEEVRDQPPTLTDSAYETLAILHSMGVLMYVLSYSPLNYIEKHLNPLSNFFKDILPTTSGKVVTLRDLREKNKGYQIFYVDDTLSGAHFCYLAGVGYIAKADEDSYNTEDQLQEKVDELRLLNSNMAFLASEFSQIPGILVEV